jgi:hypothetical protein
MEEHLEELAVAERWDNGKPVRIPHVAGRPVPARPATCALTNSSTTSEETAMKAGGVRDVTRPLAIEDVPSLASGPT